MVMNKNVHWDLDNILKTTLKRKKIKACNKKIKWV